MNDFENIIFYSINSSLANLINTKYYDDNHFVWVAPYFDCSETNPSSSNPSEIYSRLKSDLRAKTVDYHSLNIENNRAGIKKGAIAMFEKNKIDERTKNLIFSLSDQAEHQHFEPLIYVIPTNIIVEKIQTPDLKTKANTLSLEYTIPNLNGNEFDIIKI